MSQGDEFETELTAGREEIAAMVSRMADGIRTGTVQLSDGTDTVTVDTPHELTLEIELETADDETSLELELEWPGSSVISPVSSTDVAREQTDEPPDEGLAPDEAQSLAQFEVYQARDEEWRWRLRHRNGNIIASSGEGYTRKHNALKGLRSVMANSPNAAVTEEFTNQ